MAVNLWKRSDGKDKWMQDFGGETRVWVDQYESYGENPKCRKIVISLLADVSVVECRHTHTRTLYTYAHLDLPERTRADRKIARCQQITSSRLTRQCFSHPGHNIGNFGWYSSGFAHYIQASDGITPHIRIQPLLYTYLLTYLLHEAESFLRS
jgi:hypothetical protein